MPIKAAGNITVSYNSNALASYLNSASIEAIVKELVTTVLTDTGETKIPSIANWNIQVGGPWAKALDDILGPDAVSPPSSLRTLVVVYGASGSQVTLTWTSTAFIGNYKINFTNPTELATWTATLAVSGVPTRS